MLLKKGTFILLIGLLISFLVACSSDETDPIGGDQLDCSGVTSTFTADVKSIMDNNCATSGCHNSGTQANGIDLSTYDLVKSESSRARFLGSIRHESGFNRMPQGANKLSDANIEKIACWVENGAPE